MTEVFTAYGPAEAPKQTNVPTMDELATIPTRLKKLCQQCKTDRVTLGNVLYNRVAEATRKRLYDDGKTPYTPSETPSKF